MCSVQWSGEDGSTYKGRAWILVSITVPIVVKDKKVTTYDPHTIMVFKRTNTPRWLAKLEVKEDMYPPLVSNDTMEAMRKIDYSGLTPSSLFKIIYFCKKAYNHEEGGCTEVPQLCQHLRYDTKRKRAYMSCSMALYLMRFWVLPYKGEETDVVPQTEWKAEWLTPIDPRRKNRVAIDIDDNFRATECLQNEETVIQGDQGQGIPNYFRMSLNNVNTLVLSLFMARGTVSPTGSTELGYLYPRFAVAPKSINCRRIHDMKRIHSSDSKEPGMMETISGLTDMAFSTEKYYLVPYGTGSTFPGMKIEDDCILGPTYDCDRMELNHVTQDGVKQIFSRELGEVKQVFKRFYGVDFSTSYERTQVMAEGVSHHQKQGIYLGHIIQDLHKMLGGLREDEHWIRLHRHCASMIPKEELDRMGGSEETHLEVPTIKRVLWGQAMVMFAAYWSGANIGALDGSNRITSTIHCLLKIRPQETAEHVANPEPYPHSPKMGILASMVDVELILPKGGTGENTLFPPKVYEECVIFSDMIQKGKYYARESSVLEWVSGFLSDELKRDQGELHRKWLPGELREFRGKVKKGDYNKKKNTGWWAKNMNDLVGELLKGGSVPPKLAEELKDMKETSEGIVWKGKHLLKDIFPFVPERAFQPHLHLPTLQTIVAICCQTPFWNAGVVQGDEVLHSLFGLLRGSPQRARLEINNGEGMSELPITKEEYVTDLRVDKRVYRPQVHCYWSLVKNMTKSEANKFYSENHDATYRILG